MPPRASEVMQKEVKSSCCQLLSTDTVNAWMSQDYSLDNNTITVYKIYSETEKGENLLTCLTFHNVLSFVGEKSFSSSKHHLALTCII